MKESRNINEAIMENEITSADWGLNDLATELYWWVAAFQATFFKDQKVPTPVLTFERTRVTNLGYYRIGMNDFAVREQININRRYLDRPLSEILETLVHEMVHSWEHNFSTSEKTVNWYHSVVFRRKMEEIGIKTNNKGEHISIGPPFTDLLIRHHVLQSDGSDNIGIRTIGKKKEKGRSKLKKWTCGCTNVRVAVPNFKAVCLRCGAEFGLED